MKVLSLYIHVPFCTRRCSYCSFYHVPRNPRGETDFVEALTEEIEEACAALGGVRFETVFVGGGTPSALGIERLGRVLAPVVSRLGSAGESEVTCEVNPEDVTDELVAALDAHGVNRISLGVQSMDPAAQRVLKRCSPDGNRRAMEAVMDRFENVSFDVLLGVPGSSLAATRATVEELLAAGPAHLSVYCLEPGGDMGREVESFFADVDPERSADEYLMVCDALAAAGFRHYEVSNFARTGFESRHNRVYWGGGEYLGVGPGAHSFVGGRRYHNVPSLEEYLARRGADRVANRIVDPVDEGGAALERAMLALRTDGGMPLSWALCPDETINEFVAAGLAERTGDRLVLTDRGFLLTNEVVLRVCAPA